VKIRHLINIFLGICLLLINFKIFAAEDSSEVVNKAISVKTIKKLNISDYSKIIPASEYSNYGVVQKIELPKSSRVQIKTGVTTVMSDAFASSYGLSLGAVYNFDETWGVGIGGAAYSSNQTSQISNINKTQMQNTDNFLSLKNSTNASIYITPMHGKWSVFNDKILPFEVYLAFGSGQVTDSLSKSSSATSASLGQLISLTNSSAADINLQWLSYTSKNLINPDQLTNSMLLTVSYSIFWPFVENR